MRTLLHLIGGLDRPDAGSVQIDGENIFQLKEEKLAVFRRRKIGFIFQDFNLIPSMNVWENIVLPLGLDNKQVDPNYVRSIVRNIGLEDKLHAMPSTLSGGQKQRTAIARALVTRPAIICAYCYFWGGKKKGCTLGEENCYYLLKEVPKEKTKCDGCPYKKGDPCIGWCTKCLKLRYHYSER